MLGLSRAKPEHICAEALGEAGECAGLAYSTALSETVGPGRAHRTRSPERRAQDRRPGTGGRTTGRYLAVVVEQVDVGESVPARGFRGLRPPRRRG